MRRRFICALMTVPLFLLCGCGCGGGKSVDTEMRELQEALAACESFRLVADLRADYGDRVYDYRVRFDGNAEEGTVSILAPENVAGAAVRFGADGTALGFDGTDVYTGELLPEGLSPVDALPMMVSAWREGLVTETVRERLDDTDCLASVFMISEEVSLRTWFDRCTGLPLRAEVSFDGYTVLTASFYDIITD